MKKFIVFLVSAGTLVSGPALAPVYAQTYGQANQVQTQAIVSSVLPALASLASQLQALSNDYAQDQSWISSAETGLASIATQLQSLQNTSTLTDSQRQIVLQQLQAASYNIGVIQTQYQVILQKRSQQSLVLGQILEKLRLVVAMLSQ